MLRAVVMGPPMAYGSKRVFINPTTKKPVLVNSNHKNLRTWQDAIRREMLGEVTSPVVNRTPPMTRAAKIRVSIFIARPKSHYGKRGNLNGRAKDCPFPAKKPTLLLEFLLANSTDQDDLVLDPFLGSGSTLIAAEKLGRRCYGLEIDPKYVDVTVKRWEDFTGKKAILQSRELRDATPPAG